MQDLVSVCIPTYNGERFLTESLDAILSQTYSHLDILVIDDGSTDRTVDIIKAYQLQDSRIRLISNERNLGLVGNWNECIVQSQGDWVKLHFQDDLIQPDAIEKMMAYASENKLKVVLSDRSFIFEEGKRSPHFDDLVFLSDYYDQNSTLSPHQVSMILKQVGLRANFIGEPILGLIKKEVFGTLGMFDQTFSQIPDFEFWLRVMLNLNSGFMPEKLHSFRVHSGSQSDKNANYEGINPSHSDRIYLSHKLCNDPHYQFLRSQVGLAFLQKIQKEYLNTYTNVYGRKMLKDQFDQRYLQFLPPRKNLFHRIKKFFS